MSSLAGRVAIVTGAAHGIGASVAAVLAERGASVVVSDIDGAGAQAIAAKIVADGGRAIGRQVDVGEEEDIAAMVAAAVSEFGRVDILHNNAAATGAETLGRDSQMDAAAMDIEVWDRTMAINLRGVMLGCKYVIPHMLDAGRGSIVNTSSTSALAGDMVRLAYAASKGGINALTLYIATMYGKQGIRCNAIAPGFIASERHEGDDPADLQIYLQNQLSQRLGKPVDVAHFVAFLASDESEFITGQIIKLDGGMLSHLPRYSTDLFGANS